jgi:DNA-binding NarL/FixJ family response regulator
MITLAIADDHTLLRKALVTLINEFDACQVVIEAANGQELIEQLQQMNTLPQVAILDINMPVMDGHATATHIARHYPNMHTLSLSMLNDEANVLRMLQAGVKGYVLKECHPDELSNAISHVARGEYFINELMTMQIGKRLSVMNNHQPQQKEPVVSLTDKEKEFLQWSITDLTYKEIAFKMCISPRTVDSYRDVLFEKLQLKSRVGLAIYAIKNNLVTL